MCGIVGAVGQRQVSRILLEGLKRLEYRGYDSAGIAIIDKKNKRINCVKKVGKVAELEKQLAASPVKGTIGISHTRWATHGKPTENNAHPHLSSNSIALVHNGIIENHNELRSELKTAGYEFLSDTDTEVIAHLIHQQCENNGNDLTEAVKMVVARLEGAYGLAVICREQPDRILVARSGSPLIIGLGIGENFIASDPSALGRVTDRFIYLEEGDIAEITSETVSIWNQGQEVQRAKVHIAQDFSESDKSGFRHFMLKEIYEQKAAIANTLAGRISKTRVLEQAFGIDANTIFDRTKNVQIVACGTSYHAGMIAKFWFENIARMPCAVDIASEYRYRKVLVPDNCLYVSISQSGETADTLAAQRFASEAGYVGCLAICNVANSSLV
ncbi:MAG: glutamine--fructose-6-phosphate transaminase (isomerizing), partial [Pseudohongiellaceae bacterium]